MSRDHAEVISIAEQRAAREARRDRGAVPSSSDTAGTRNPQPRAKCAAGTSTGRPCRNYATDGSLCRVHAVRARGDERGPDGPAEAPATDTDAATDRAGSTQDGGPAAGPAGAGAPGFEDLERLAEQLRHYGRRVAVDGVAVLDELSAGAWAEELQAIAAYLQRRLTGDYEIDDFGFDEDLTTNLLMPLIRPLHRHYWRVSSSGAEHLPAGGGVVVANHAGTLPLDAVITRLDIFDATGRHARELGADLVFRTPFVGEWARKTGVTLASGDDADRLLARGELVAVWPEGYKGLGKPWKDRYKLQRFGRGGFVATALRAGVPIVPTAIVGSEEIYPMVFDLRLVARALGLPYFPIVAQMLALPIFGPLALLPLPSKWIIEYGEPIDTAGIGPDAADDPMTVFDLTDQVRERIQSMLERNLMGRRSVFL